MKLFDNAPYAIPPGAWPLRDSDYLDWRGWLSHPQFEYERTRAVFGNREGWGPLLICPDTNLLIDVAESFDAVESHFGLAGSLPPVDCANRINALRDLFALWFHRDIRWVISDLYIDDARKPLSESRRAQRLRVLDALRADLSDRGGTERGTADWDLSQADARQLKRWTRADNQRRSCIGRYGDRVKALLPGFDGMLVADALREGCHVFLTEDRGILGQRERLFGWGISVLRPGSLLDELDAVGELGALHAEAGLGPAPDLLSLTRFYEMQPE